MTAFWLTYRIHEMALSNRDYDERRSALVSTIKHYGNHVWDEPTSFLMFESYHSLDFFATKIAECIDSRVDLVLIGKVHFKGGRVIGNVNDPETLTRHMDFVEFV